MKLKILILVLLLVSGVLPALSQGGTLNTVTFNDFGFSFDSALATNVNIVQFPGDPATAEMPGGPDVRHTQFLLYNQPPAPESLFDQIGGVRVYKTADFAGYEFPSQQLQQLQTLLAERPDLTPYMAVTENASDNALPFMPVMPAAQVIRARAQYAETAGVKGISYVTVYRQDASPFLANEFLYTFQGLSADGAYYISAVFRLNTTLFPAEIAADFDPAAFAAGMMDYFAESTATLNAASPADFAPSLTSLDAVIQSFAFAGTSTTMPEPDGTTSTSPTMGGLAGTTWTLVSYGSADSPQPVLENAPITLAFSEEGAGGKSGCNSYNGAFQYENETLTLGAIASTMMACDEAIMAQETAYLDALGKAASFEITDAQLQIFYEGGVLTFTASS